MITPDLKTFLFTYQYEGAEYALRVPAYSREEALGRVRRMSTALYDGEIKVTIPVPEWPVRALGRLRDFFARTHP